MTRRIAPLAAALAILAAPLLASAQWTAPTQSPPSGNANAPINTSGTTQTKSGSLVVGSLGSSGGGYFLGNFGIATTSPFRNLHVDGAGSILRVGPVYSGADRDFVEIQAHGTDSRIVSSNERFHIENLSSQPLILNGSGGYVGIGTISPAGKLQVSHSSAEGALSLILQTNNSSAANGTIRWRDSVGNNEAGIGSNFNVSDSGGIEFLNGNTTNMVVRSTGNVGIATTTPGYTLTVGGDINFTGTLRQNGSAFSSGGQWATNGNDIYKTNSGNVGINTTSPQAALQVYSGNVIVGSPAIAGPNYLQLVHAGSTGATNRGYISFANSLTTPEAEFTFGTPNGASGGRLSAMYNSAEVLSILSGGNVGIGTAGPSYKLDVNGNLAMTGSAIVHRGSGDLDTTGAAYTSWQDNSTGSYVERGWVGFGVGDASIGLQNNAGPVQLRTSAGAVVTATAGGNVGIGTASPAQKLDVNGQAVFGGGAAKIYAFSDASGGYLSQTANGGGQGVAFNGGGTGFMVGGAWAAYLNTSGNLGIGTTNPQDKLHVVDTTQAVGNPTVRLEGRVGGYGAGIEAGAPVTGGSYLAMGKAVWDGENSWNTTASTQDSYFTIHTAQDGSLVERLRITSSGNVGVGNTSTNDKLSVTQNWFDNSSTDFGGGIRLTGTAPSISFYDTDNTTNKWMIHNNTETLNFYRRPSGGGWDQMAYFNASGELVETHAMYSPAFYYSSDRSLKENIEPLQGALDKVLSLQGVSFDWKKDGKASVGLIAQDVEKVYPEIVTTNEQGLKSVQYGNLVAPLIEAVKEQQKTIDSQEQRIRALEEKLELLTG